MKKHFLLGLAAMLLPWTAWAQGQFEVTGVNETYVYNGVQSLTPTVKAYNTDLEAGEQYTISYTLNDEPVNEVKNVGTYKMTIAGVKGTLYENLTSTTIEFTVTKKQLTSLSLSETGGTKVYGTKDEDVKLNTFVPEDGIDGLVTGEGEYENALKCLYLQRIDTENGKEVANNTYKVIVRGYVESVETGSNYYYKEGQNIDAVDMTILPKELTVTIDGDNNSDYTAATKTVTAKIDEDEIFVYNDTKDDVVVAFEATVAGTNSANTTLLNADTYTLTAKLTGADAGNYTLANDGKVTYTINRAKLEITVEDPATLTKVYDGTDVKNLTEYYTINTNTSETITDLHLTMIKDAGADAGEYLVNVCINGTAIKEANYQKPGKLPNYWVDYKKSELPYTITAKPVKYYFVSESKEYDGKEVDEPTYEIAFEEYYGFVGDDTWTEDYAPEAAFEADATVKNVATYNLVLKTGSELKVINSEEVDVTANYDIQLVEEKSVFEITAREMTITVKNQELDFNATDEDIASKLLTWATWNNGNGTIIANEKGNDNEQLAADRTAIRDMFTLDLSDEVKEKRESRTYEDGVVIKFNESLTEDQLAILANYGGKDEITLEDGDLTIKSVSTPLVLDGSEVAEEVEEGEETIMEKLTRLDGAMVDEIQVKNLRNFLDDDYNFEETETIKAENWYTLVLPFEVTVRELSEKFGYAIVNIPNTANENADKILFKLTMQTVPANTLMAFKVDKDIEWDANKTITFTGKKIVAPTDEYTADKAGNKFIGVYKKTTITGEQDWYLVPNEGEFYSAEAIYDYYGYGYEVYPLNGYVHFEQPATAGIARTIGFENPDGTTSIVSATTGRVISNNAEGWYTVGGIKLNGEPTQKGIYINNGKKVVIK